MNVKKIPLILLSLILVVCLSGCSLNFFSVESLLSPPKQPGKIGEVQDAFYKLVNGTSVQLKAPSSGQYQTSMILTDINNDDVEEAFVFYTDSSSVEGSVRLAFMEYKSRKWTLSVDIKGAGSGVYEVNFRDLDSDGISEVFVSWSIIDASTARVLSVYQLSQKNDNSQLISLSTEYCNAGTFADVNSDGKEDLILMYLDDTGPVQKSFLRFFTLGSDGSLMKYAEILLDSSIDSVSRISYDILNKQTDFETVRLFIDCQKTDRQMFTELIVWNSQLKHPVKVFEQPSVSGIRNSSVFCYDVDGDGLLEIPVFAKLYGDENSFRVNKLDEVYTLSLIKWKNAQGDKTGKQVVTLYNSLENYHIKFPWGNDVTVYYDSLREALLFCEWNEEEKHRGDELFSVSYRTEDVKNEIIGSVLSKDENGVYYYKLTDAGKSFGLTDEKIIYSFIKAK